MSPLLSRSKRARRFIVLRLWPVLAALGSALVMLLAFLVPSIQDQWDRYQARKVIEEYAGLGDRFMAEANYPMAEAAYEKGIELSEGKRLDIEVKRLRARVGRMNTVVNWGDSLPADLEEVDFQFLLHMPELGSQERADVLHGYGMFLATAHREKEALQVLLEALSLDPKEAGIHVSLGDLYDQNGMKEKAASEFRQAISMDPANAEAHYNLGLIDALDGKDSSAVKELLVADSLSPGDTALAARLREIRGGDH